MTSFLDFHLIVNRVSDDDPRFISVVADAPVSRWGSTFDCFGSAEELEARLGEPLGVKTLSDSRSGMRLEWLAAATSPPGPGAEGRDAALPPRFSQPRVRELGRELFSALFPPGSNAYHLLGKSCQVAKAEGSYLRLKLELHKQLANLPWEILRPPLDGLWAQEINQAKLSIVRYQGDIRRSANGASAPAARGKPCVLIVQADPRDRGPGRMAGSLTQSFFSERKRVEEILRRHAEEVDCLVIQEPGTRDRLARTVHELELGGRPVVGLHFIGHGGIDGEGGFLVGENEALESEPIYEAELRSALDRARSLRWVIFNACWTASEPVGCPLAGLATAMAVVQDVPTVIAYRRPVDTSDAEKLAADFYTLVLAEGLPVEDAVRTLQARYENPGGLVVLMRSVEGRLEDVFPSFARRGAASEGPGAEPAEPPAGRTATGPTADEEAPGEEPAEGEASDEEPADGDERVEATAAGETRVEGRRSSRSRPPGRRRATSEEIAALAEMVHVPAGPFKKGLTEAQMRALVRQFHKANLPLDFDSAREVLGEEKRETVELPEFWIDATPVTNAQFARFVDSTGHLTEAERRNSPQNWRLHAAKEDHPVVFVSYDDAVAFCEWAGKRLPTADEWKKAYRGPKGRVYPWGPTFDLDVCNTAESQHGWETTPVERFPRGTSPYGCYDMVGNVEEWTSTTAPRGNKIILGGSWCMTCQVYGLPVLHRVASPSFHSNEQGFRCVRDARA